MPDFLCEKRACNYDSLQKQQYDKDQKSCCNTNSYGTVSLLYKLLGIIGKVVKTRIRNRGKPVNAV